MYTDPCIQSVGPLSQMGQIDLWMMNPTRSVAPAFGTGLLPAPSFPGFPFGKLHTSPSFLSLAVDWTYWIPPVLPTLTTPYVPGHYLTPADQRQLSWFESIVLRRQNLQQFVRPEGWSSTYLSAPFPDLVYTKAHFLSTLLNAGPVFGVRWYLWCDDASDDTSTSTFDAGPDQTSLTGDDSLWNLSLVWRYATDAQGNTTTSFDPVSGSFFPSATPPGPITTWINNELALWQLTPTPPLTPFFHPFVKSSWTIVNNPLNFPPHLIYLQPFLP